MEFDELVKAIVQAYKENIDPADMSKEIKQTLSELTDEQREKLRFSLTAYDILGDAFFKVSPHTLNLLNKFYQHGLMDGEKVVRQALANKAIVLKVPKGMDLDSEKFGEIILERFKEIMESNPGINLDEAREIMKREVEKEANS